MMNREAVWDRLQDVFFSDETCNDPDCDDCQATLDALVDRVVFLMTMEPRTATDVVVAARKTRERGST